jgi:rhodanese-related sulfurtransferase
MRNSITKQKIEELKSDGVIINMIDIRTNEEFQKQHIPGIMHILAETLIGEIGEFSKDEIIVCVCNHGKERSQKAAETLYHSGFTNSFYLEGGTSGWFE